MRSRSLVAILVGSASALCATPAAMAQTPSSPASFRPMEWVRTPNFSSVWTDLPQHELRNRAVQVTCTVTAAALIEDCEANDLEDGTVSRRLMLAINQMMRGAEVRPATVNGQPQEGRIAFLMFMAFDTRADMSRPSLVDPVWSEAPSRQDIARARTDPRSGMARLTCELDRDGRLEDCDAVLSVPRNARFDRAALALAPMFRTQVRLPEGVSYQDIRASVTIQFPGAEDIVDNSYLTRPTWLTAPSVNDLSSRYPVQARSAGVREGRATADCVVQANGYLGDCTITAVSPQNMGFEAAALSIAPMFSVTRWDNQGYPNEGRRVRLPFAFADVVIAREATPQ